MKTALVLVAAIIGAVGCANDQHTYVAQRGYLGIRTVASQSQIAAIRTSDETVIVDQPVEDVAQDSWITVDDDPDVPSALPQTVTVVPSPTGLACEPAVSGPAMKAGKGRPVAKKRKARPVECSAVAQGGK